MSRFTLRCLTILAAAVALNCAQIATQSGNPVSAATCPWVGQVSGPWYGRYFAGGHLPWVLCQGTWSASVSADGTCTVTISGPPAVLGTSSETCTGRLSAGEINVLDFQVATGRSLSLYLDFWGPFPPTSSGIALGLDALCYNGEIIGQNYELNDDNTTGPFLGGGPGLSQILITGPDGKLPPPWVDQPPYEVWERSNTQFKCTAYDDSGNSTNVTGSATWSVGFQKGCGADLDPDNCPYSLAGGVLTAPVANPGNQDRYGVVLTAKYQEGDRTRTATKVITVKAHQFEIDVTRQCATPYVQWFPAYPEEPSLAGNYHCYTGELTFLQDGKAVLPGYNPAPCAMRDAMTKYPLGPGGEEIPGCSAATMKDGVNGICIGTVDGRGGIWVHGENPKNGLLGSSTGCVVVLNSGNLYNWIVNHSGPLRQNVLVDLKAIQGMPEAEACASVPSGVGTAGALALSAASVQAVAGGRQSLVFTLSAPAAVQVRILNLAGRLVRTLSDYAGRAGVNTLAWDGRSTLGTPVPGGMYLVQMVARADSGGQAQAVAACCVRR
jgi:hypothetical protein